MSVCRSCNGRLSSKQPGLQCSGDCGRFYHAKCVKITVAELANYKKEGVFWKCCSCREVADRSVIIDEDQIAVASLSSAPSPEAMYQLLRSIQTEIKQMNAKYTELVNSISFYGDKISDFENTLKGFGDKVKRLESVTAENVRLRSVVVDLTSRVEHLEQYSRLNNLILTGIPEKRDEDLCSSLLRIGEVINCPLTKHDIDAIHRLPSRPPAGNETRNRVVCVITFSRPRRGTAKIIIMVPLV